MCNGDCKGECENCKCKDSDGKCECQTSTDKYRDMYKEKYEYSHPAHADGVNDGPPAPEMESDTREGGTADNPNDGEQFPDN